MTRKESVIAQLESMVFTISTPVEYFEQCQNLLKYLKDDNIPYASSEACPNHFFDDAIEMCNSKIDFGNCADCWEKALTD